MIYSNTRDTIVDAATAVVSARGVKSATTREICDRAGVTAPTLYHHFGDKQGLMAAVVSRAFERYLAQKRALRPTGDPRKDVRRGWDAHVAFARSNPVLYQLMWPSGSPSLPEAAAESGAALLRAFQDLAIAGALRPNSELSDTVRDAIVDALILPDST